jgi:hypothetical protein
MTIVAAKKTGNRIVVMSETMITNPAGNNSLPGRLKSIVLNEWLTVSYAGLSAQAIDAIRALKRLRVLSTELAVRELMEVSETYADELDFIVCSHEDQEASRLIKITNGRYSEGSDIYWIGNAEAAAALSRTETNRPKSDYLPDYVTDDEVQFTHQFHVYMEKGRDTGVGGAIVNCLCSQFGHCYQSHAGAFAWDTIILGQGDHEARRAANKTGMYYFEYNVCAPAEPGEAVLGLYLAQSGAGYVYEPLIRDEARKVFADNQHEFSMLVSRTASESKSHGGHGGA